MVDNLLVMGLLDDKDFDQLLGLIDPTAFDYTFNKSKFTCVDISTCYFFIKYKTEPYISVRCHCQMLHNRAIWVRKLIMFESFIREICEK